MDSDEPLADAGTADAGTVVAGTVVAVAASPVHGFTKDTADEVSLLVGLGVAGDAHSGTTDQHRSHARADPTRPNLRQVHLIHDELLEELRGEGFDVPAGSMGENVTTRGLDLMGLPRGARLHLGASAVVEVTGLRNPCHQIDDNLGRGLLRRVLHRDPHGDVVRRSGVMGVVLAGGPVRPGDAIGLELPAPPHARLQPV